MPVGRLVVLAALGYAALCLIFISLVALLASLFYWLRHSVELAPALAITGAVGLVPVIVGVALAAGKSRSSANANSEPLKLDLHSLLAEWGTQLGRDASDFAHQKPLQTMLIAGLVGFISAANPKLVMQILKGLKL